MRRLSSLLLTIAMVAFGLGVYLTLGSAHSRVVSQAPAPLASARPAVRLPGTLYLVQDSSLYRLQNGVFTQLTPPGGWQQPALSPDGSRLVAVKRAGNVSDLYQLGRDGSVQQQLTHNGAGIVEVNHWAFYPRYTADGSRILFSTDRPKVYDFRVDLAVWDMPAAGGAARQWTSPNHYTGGDVTPVPAAGGLIYTRYAVDGKGESTSAIQLAPRALAAGAELTPPADRCSQPALSPDGARLAMICAAGPRDNRLVVAPFDGRALGARVVLVSGTLAASPAWAPDGSGVAYLAPDAADPGGPFQLWWAPAGGQPVQVTRNAALDALSAPAWSAS